jgi:hypothetical protein
VVFAADYPFLDIFWTMLIFLAWVMFFWILIKTLGDVFRRRDIGGGKKTLWVAFMVFFPFVGIFCYLIANGRQMAERDVEQIAASQQQFDTYVRSVASNGGAAAEIDRAKRLLDERAITPEEYEALKAKALS